MLFDVKFTMLFFCQPQRETVVIEFKPVSILEKAQRYEILKLNSERYVVKKELSPDTWYYWSSWIWFYSSKREFVGQN